VSRKNDLEKLITAFKRRLQKRKEQQARYGIATEPHILVEIEDIETQIAERQAELATLEEISRLNPYRGLSAFQEEDQLFFFGREIFTAQLVERVQQKPLVAVLGPSGSGKSSIVFAGLVPKLKRLGRWCFASFRPGKDPFLGLASVLVPLYETDLNKTEQLGATRSLSISLREGRYPLSDVLHLIHQTHLNSRLLIVADQFEELYTLCRDTDTRQQFLDMLLETLGTASEASSHLVLTMRADFLGQALLYPQFGDALQGTIELLRPMNPHELRMAIEKPAELLEVHFEPGLIERILEGGRNEPGNMPLLEFALTALWEQQIQGELAHTAYETVGRVEGALSNHADEIFKGLSESKQVQARRIFIQLVRPGEGTEDTRRLAYRHELSEEDWLLVQRLASERLVVTNRDPVGQETVEIAHEALIRGWEHLKEWMDQNRDFRAWQERLRIALHQWQDSTQQDKGLLLRGKPLADANRWLAERGVDLGTAERDFIQASVTQWEQEQQREEEARRDRLILRLIRKGAQGQDLSGINLSRADLSGVNVSGTNLSRADLSGANLSNADLSNADLSNADLSQADLSGANLSHANLTNANLGGADLHHATLSGASLSQTNLSATNLRHAHLSGATLNQTNLIEADLRHANLSGATLSQINLIDTDLRYADLRRAEISNTTQIAAKWRLVGEIVTQGAAERDLSGTDLSEANLNEANLSNADLIQANLSGAILNEANLHGANLRGANLGNVHLHKANLNRANLSGANLNEANLSNADLRNGNLNNARLRNANLNEANLSYAHLHNAILNKADLSEANLMRTNLSNADLSGANLSHANLTNADLSEANLSYANLRRAILNKAKFNIKTDWPNGFDPEKAGAELVEE
jgi:uncharacterized protein YjbI with pentapeptide repeats